MEWITPIASQIDASPTPRLPDIYQQQKALAPWILTTPVWPLQTQTSQAVIGSQGELFFKIECWQHTGTFKARGAVTRVMSLSEAERKKGIVAVSAGNHAIAASYAAHCFNTSAKVLMPKTAPKVRVHACQSLGAEVLFTDTMHQLFPAVEEIIATEGRALVHPFDGPEVALGTATLGAELCQQVENLDAVLIAVGGGGLISGMASAIKQIQPRCEVIGIEPRGANTMTQSFQAGRPITAEELSSIASSLSAPHACAYSYSLCQQHVDAMINVSDDEIRRAMRWLYNELKMALEPAGATAMAALLGPLKKHLKNKRVAVMLCGSNLDIETFYHHTQSHD